MPNPNEAAQVVFTRTKEITLPIMKIACDKSYYIQPTAAMFLGKKLDGDDEAATLLNCTNLETGESVQIVVPSVLKSILEESYKEDSYVGVNMEFIKGQKPSGKRYHPFTVCEVSVG